MLPALLCANVLIDLIPIIQKPISTWGHVRPGQCPLMQFSGHY